MSRKGENIYKRKDGRWEGRYIKEHMPDGKVRYAYIYGRSYTETKQKLLEARILLLQKQEQKKSILQYKDILFAWLSITQTRTKASTYSRYWNLTKNHILPYLGELSIESLTTQKIEQHIIFLLSSGRIDGQGGLSPKTTSDILTIVKESIKHGHRNGVIFSCNLNGLFVKKSVNNMRVLDKVEQEALLAILLHNTDLRKFGVLLCLYTGIRIGEICALKWENIDLINGVISIRKTLQRIQCTESCASCKTKIIITEPKSNCSIRDIPLPAFLTKMAQAYCSKPEAYILTGHEDHYIEPRLLQYEFKKYIHECGLEGVNYHALRHTFATRCIELGFDAKTLSEILGHTNVNITLNRYVHSSINTKRLCMEKFTI